MPTSGIGGFKAKLMLSTVASGAVTLVAELRDFNINATNDPLNVTSHDSSGDREIISGITQWSGDANALFVPNNATHKALWDLLDAGTKVEGEFFPTGSSSDGYYSGRIVVTGWNPAAPMEEALALDVTFDGTGALTRTSSST